MAKVPAWVRLEGIDKWLPVWDVMVMLEDDPVGAGVALASWMRHEPPCSFCFYFATNYSRCPLRRRGRRECMTEYFQVLDAYDIHQSGHSWTTAHVRQVRDAVAGILTAIENS